MSAREYDEKRTGRDILGFRQLRKRCGRDVLPRKRPLKRGGLKRSTFIAEKDHIAILFAKVYIYCRKRSYSHIICRRYHARRHIAGALNLRTERFLRPAVSKPQRYDSAAGQRDAKQAARQLTAMQKAPAPTNRHRGRTSQR